ncbi:acetylornithine deacetylase [Rhodobacteraceae bacterium NNCM2]|nr:acetylornithine deacetylase [Coraliihabitans acroporae]
MTRTIEILERLIAFPTISRTPNMALIDYARGLLEAAGARCQIIAHPSGTRANLYATLGPEGQAGVMLSGHTDVVPVEGQAWSTDPFRLFHRDGRLQGRGTADMKGFCAAILAAAERAGELKTPLHFALSFDEEIGCIGVRSLVDMLENAPVRPALCIVGEPTAMAVATGHKGKTALRTTFIGREGHSALAPLALNALHLAADFIGILRAEQASLAASGRSDGDYDVPYTTVHAGIIRGGVQVNIVPNRAELDWEIRNLAGDDPAEILARIEAAARDLVAATNDADAAITTEITNAYPGLDTPKTAEAVAFVKSLTGANGTIKVAFGTEGGLFDRRLGIPTVVCGPGSMAQGHKPDEYVTEEQLARCDAMLDGLIERLKVGLRSAG